MKQARLSSLRSEDPFGYHSRRLDLPSEARKPCLDSGFNFCSTRSSYVGKLKTLKVRAPSGAKVETSFAFLVSLGDPFCIHFSRTKKVVRNSIDHPSTQKHFWNVAQLHCDCTVNGVFFGIRIHDAWLKGLRSNHYTTPYKQFLTYYVLLSQYFPLFFPRTIFDKDIFQTVITSGKNDKEFYEKHECDFLFLNIAYLMSSACFTSIFFRARTSFLSITSVFAFEIPPKVTIHKCIQYNLQNLWFFFLFPIGKCICFL